MPITIIPGRPMRLAACALAALAALIAACAGGASVAETDSVVSGVPFIDGERHVYRLIDRDGALAGTGTFTTARDGDAWALTQTYENTAGAVVDESLVLVDAATMQPRSMTRTIPRDDGDEVVTASYETKADGSRTARVRHARGGDERERTIDLNAHDYEDQSSLWLWRTLALGDGLETRYTSVDPREGGRVTASVAQVDRQTLETPVGTFDTWVLQIRTGRETVNVWLAVEPPHAVVRFDNGRLFFELESADVR